MKTGDLVQYIFDVGYNHIYSDKVKIGIFLNETDEMVDPRGICDQRRYSNILTADGKIVKTYNYLKINL